MIANKRGVAGADSSESVVRKDPVLRPLDGIEPWGKVTGTAPGSHYVLVSKQSQQFGIDHYASMGYAVELQREDGPSISGFREKQLGAPVEARGCVLMSCSAEHYARLREFGPDGESGDQLTRQMEKRMLLGARRPMRSNVNAVMLRPVEGEHDFGMPE
jgi:hypothetical protein